MAFVSPEGRREILWVAAAGHDRWRVMNVPVWQYGISYGTVVTGRPEGDTRLRFQGVSRQSSGATVRAIVPRPKVAREVYHSVIQPGVAALGTGVGPATHYDPPLVAFHVHERAAVHGKVASYLDRLVAEGIITHWEIGDPEPEPEPLSVERAKERADELVHERPTVAH